MKQYGLKITKKDGATLEIYYQSISYIDWSLYASTEEMFEPSTTRYLINTYVSRVIESGTDIPPASLLTEDISIIHRVVNALFKKSLFDDENAFLAILTTLEKRSRTLIGCYDLFLFLKMGPEFYIQMLDQDAYTRAQIIMMIEKSTGISVKERFEHAVHHNIPLDIISDPDTYNKNLRKHGGPVPLHPQRKTTPLQNHQQTMNGLQNNTDTDSATTVQTMLDDSRIALQEALSTGRNKSGKRPSFNWGSDEAQFNQFNQD